MTEYTKIKHRIRLLSHNLWNIKRRTMGNWGPMYSFSAYMKSKISQLKFGAHKFGRVQWSRIKPLEKNSWSRAPNSPSGHQEGPNFPIARVSNLPITSSKPPSMFRCAIRGPIFCFPHQVIYPQFTHCFIKGFQFHHCIIKGPQIFHCTIKGPQFSSSCHQKDDL